MFLLLKNKLLKKSLYHIDREGGIEEKVRRKEPLIPEFAYSLREDV